MSFPRKRESSVFQSRWAPVSTGVTGSFFFLILLSATVLFISSARAQEKVRVLVIDGLPSIALNVPDDFSIKGADGKDLRIGRDGSGNARLELDDPDTDGGVRIDAAGSVVNVNKYSLTGIIEIDKGRGGFRIINELGLEDYTRAVVGEEMASKWPIEALKAQAVIARTYALYRKRKAGGGDYDLCSTVDSQVFNGDAKAKEGPALAAKETEGEVLTWQGEPIEAVYHSSCGGETEDAADVWGRSFPYLKSRECQCGDESPYARWEKAFTPSYIESALAKDGKPVYGIARIKITLRSGTGRVKAMMVIGASGQVALKGIDFRRAMGYSQLPSTAFEVHEERGKFIFIGRGSGHGVGLCQWGAKVMADEGKTYREILEYYYPGATLTKLAPAEGN